MISRLLLASAASAVLLSIAVAAACGDGDGAATARPTTPGASPTGPVSNRDRSTEKVVPGPASRYSVLLQDLPRGQYLTDIPNTYVLALECQTESNQCTTYARSAAFDSVDAGKALLKQWEYAGGYETSILPEGYETAVLNGAYYIIVESHLFKSVDGAKLAFEYFKKRIDGNRAATAEAEPPVGNQAAAWSAVGAPIRPSNIPAVSHWVLFRRGNMVAVTKTIGAQGFMTTQQATILAELVDDKALGVKDAIEPTPTSNFTPPARTVVPPGTVSPPPFTITPRATPTR